MLVCRDLQLPCHRANSVWCHYMHDCVNASYVQCDAWLPVAANHTFAGNPTPQLDSLPNGGPLHGWAQTSGYNAITSLGPDSALVCYDQMGWVSTMAYMRTVQLLYYM